MTRDDARTRLTSATRGPVVMGAALLFGVVVLAASSHAAIPVGPVPITLQTLAVTVIGAVYGWRLGALTVVLWLALAAAGVPLMLSGEGGIARFSGPTAGYLFAFPFAAALTGWLAARARSLAPLFAVMVAGNGVCLILGWAWLAAAIGAQTAFSAGVLPFLPGALVKSALGAMLVIGLWRLAGARGAKTK